MKLIIKGTPDEIAALAAKAQGLETPETPISETESREIQRFRDHGSSEAAV